MPPIKSGQYGVLDVPDTHPRLAAAVACALALVKHCKKGSWAELVEAFDAQHDDVARLYAQLRITEEQFDLMDRAARRGVLGLVRVGSRGAVETIVVCQECGLWVPVGKRQPAKCVATLGCAGEVVKASPAKIKVFACDPEALAG